MNTRWLFLVCWAIPSLTWGAVKPGDLLPVPKHQWVTVLEPVENGNGSFEAGESCSIKEGGKIRIESILAVGKTPEKALVTYLIDAEQFGAPCPSGTSAYLPVAELEQFQSRYETILRVRRENKKEVDQIINGEGTLVEVGSLRKGQTLELTKSRWIVLMLPTHNRNGSFQAEDRCRIAQGDKVYILGFFQDQERALLSYVRREASAGTQCPDDAVFAVALKHISKL